jgi:hypothetical protein
MITNYKNIKPSLASVFVQNGNCCGGITILFGLYFAWGNLTAVREGQITERFTRAIDQLGNKKMEIRLGGIYALERIANESEKDYYPIMKILAAYIREKSYVKENAVTEDYEQQENDKPLSTDIQVILDLIYKREHSFNEILDLRNSNLRNAQLFGAHLEWANLIETHLEGAYLMEAHLEGADLRRAHLEGTILLRAHLGGTDLQEANLEGARLERANLEGAYLQEANLEGARLERANLEGADLEKANLKGAKNLTIDQLSNVKTLYKAKLDDGLLIPLKEKYPALFEKPEE